MCRVMPLPSLVNPADRRGETFELCAHGKPASSLNQQRGRPLAPVDKLHRRRMNRPVLLTTRCQVLLFPLRSPLDIW